MIVPIFIKQNTPELRQKLSDLGLPCNNGKWMGQYLAVFYLQEKDCLTYVGSPEYDLKNCPNYTQGVICTSEDRFMDFVTKAVEEEKQKKGTQK